MIKNKEEFFYKFTKILPGQFDNNNQNLKEFSIYFDHFTKDAVEEMHRYSIDQSFYEHYEFDAFTSIDETRAYMDKLLHRMSGDKDERVTTYWLIRRKADNYLIGTAGLIDLNFARQSIEWGYGVDPKLWGKGYILQIQKILKDYVFNVLELNRIHGVTMANNYKTIESIQAAGMSHEGISRDHYCKNGQFIDGWRYAMIRNDYEKQTFSKLNNQDISPDQIVSLINEVLENEIIDINSSMENTDTWDSLNHMLIMVALKEKLGLDLSPSDIADAVSVKEILKIVQTIKN